MDSPLSTRNTAATSPTGEFEQATKQGKAKNQLPVPSLWDELLQKQQNEEFLERESSLPQKTHQDPGKCVLKRPSVMTL